MQKVTHCQALPYSGLRGMHFIRKPAFIDSSNIWRDNRDNRGLRMLAIKCRELAVAGGQLGFR